MATRSTKRNEYFKLKTKIEITKQTIFFLKKCKKSRIFPKFIRIEIGIRNKRTMKVIEEAKKMWLSLEISHLQSCVSFWEKETYDLQIFLLKSCKSDIEHEMWLSSDRNMREVIDHKKTLVRIKQNAKHKSWRSEQVGVQRQPLKPKPRPVQLDEFVINLSSVELSEDEKELLNKGLNFVLPPERFPIEDVCVDIMSAVRYLPRESKNDIETNAVDVVREKLNCNSPNISAIKVHRIVRSVRAKKLVISKADKSNNVMVMDESYYCRVMSKTIRDGPYVELDNDPLKEMIDEVDDILEKHKFTLCDDPSRELRTWKVSNQQVPCLYGLLKYHKATDEDGDYKVRPVASNINAPTESIAKKLSSIFNAMPPPKGRSIKNGTEFARLVNGMKVSRNEEMGSYDVTALYPSVPIDFSMLLLKAWLILNGVVGNLNDAYVELSRLCMKQNIFIFRGKFYKQSDGTCIGNSLSSFVAECFMCWFESSLEKHPMFPRVYFRFVDDIYAVQNKRRFDAVKKLFEDQMDTAKKGAIKFTIERQHNNELPFLNTLVKSVNGTLEVDVYRKPTSTQRRITSDSYHDIKHKLAAYHSMAHFMFSLPLSENKILNETQKIVDIGRANGYCETTIRNIISKHRNKRALMDFSTLRNATSQGDQMKRVGVRYFPEVTDKLKPVFKSHNLELVHRSDGSLKQALGSIKDIPPDLHKSGIYRIQCGHCGRFYFGMTIRKLFIRFNEHIKSAKWKTKTAVGKHIFSSKHQVDISALKLVQEVKQKWKIEYYEAVHIYKNKHQNLLNVDLGNIISPLLDLFTLEKIIDDDIVDLTNDTLDESMNDEFFDCV